MVKLSEQIRQELEKRYTVPFEKLPRTQRKLAIIEYKKEVERRKGILKETQEKVKEMTFEEYKKFYPTMEGWLKEAYQSPEKVEAERERQLQQNISKVKEKQNQLREEIKQIQIEETQELRRLRELKDRYTSEEYKEKKRSIEDEYDEDEAKLIGQLDGYKEGLEMLEGGQFISLGDINKYAKDIGKYEEKKEKASNKGRRLEREREAEIKGLVEKGFKPMLIQELEKGQLKKATITFIHPTERKVVSVKGLEFGIREVSKLPVSELGKVRVPMVYEFGGKAFEIAPTLQLYKEPTGRLVTGLGRLQQTEQEVLKQIEEPIVTTETPPLILQEEFIPSVETPKTETKTGEEIAKEVEEPVMKKRKWGITTGLSVFGAKIGTLKTKTNPSLPPKSTDKLTTIKSVFKEIREPEFKRGVKESGVKLLKEAYSKPFKETVEYVRKKEPLKMGITTGSILEKERVIEKREALPPITPSTPAPSPPPKVEYDLTKYNLYHEPKTDKMVYLPKDIKEIPVEYRGMKQVEKLGYDPETDKLRAFSKTEEIPKGYQRISPTSLKRVFGKEGLEAEEYAMVMKKRGKEAKLWQKPILAVAPRVTYADPFGLKTTTIGWGNIVHKATKGKYGYSDKGMKEKLQKIETEFWTRYAIGETGEKVKPFGKFYIESPVAQASLIYAGSVGAGATVGAIEPVAVGLTKPVVATGLKIGFTGVLGAGAIKTAKQLKREEAPIEEWVSKYGTQAVFIGAGVKGFQTGMKHPLPVRYGKVGVETPTGKMVEQKVWKAGKQVKMKVPEMEEQILYRGVYYRSPVTKEVTALLGRAKVPTKVTGGFAEKYTTQWVRGFPEKIAYPKGAFEKGYVPSTPLETAYAEKYIKLYGTPAQQQLVSSALYVRRGTEFVKTKPIGFKEFKDVEAVKHLPPKAQKELVKWIKGQKGDYMVYGSETAKAYMGKEFARPVHDIDMQFAKAKGTTKAEEVFKILRKAGAKVTLDPTTKTQIMVKSPKGEVKLMDIHGYDAPEITSEMLYGFQYQTPIKVEGIKAMPLSQTATQKLAGSLTFQQIQTGRGVSKVATKLPKITGKQPIFKFAPEPLTSPKAMATLKHPADLYAIEKFQIERLTGLKALMKPVYRAELQMFKEAGIQEFGAKAFAEPTRILAMKITPSPIPSPAPPISPILPIIPSPSVSASKIANRITSMSIATSKASASPSISISPSVSPSISISPSISPSISISPSPSPSVSPSVSISPSPSPSPSVSVSPSPSPSVSVSPSPSPSLYPTVTPPPPPTFFLWEELEGKKKKKKKLKKKIKEVKGYVPSFTARIIGAEPMELSQAGALKLISQIQTGFELRKPVKIVKTKLPKFPKTPKIKKSKIK